MREPSARAARSRPIVGLAGLALLGALACADPPAPAPLPRGPSGPEPVAVATPRRIGTSGGFDLVATADGALLAWGPAASDGGGVRVLGLSPLGASASAERDVSAGALVAARASDEAPRQVVELVAIASGTTLAVAWIAPNARTDVAEASVSSGGIEGFGPAFSIGDAASVVVSPLSARGRITALVGEEGALRVRVRTPPRACGRDVPPCEGTRRFRLDDASRRGAAEGPDESVPDVCEPFLVGGLWSEGTYFHGLCHVEAGAPSAVVYALDPEPMHAAAVDPLPGCEPLTLAPTPAGAALVARCPEGISVAWIDGTGHVEGAARPAHRETVCEGGRATLAVVGADGARLEVPLTTPLSRLEGLLDESVAGSRARAVWTGSALLVAAPDHGEVVLARWQCPPHPGPMRRSDGR